ncbi:RNA-binding protein-related protein, partial [Prunus dulcis]
ILSPFSVISNKVLIPTSRACITLAPLSCDSSLSNSEAYRTMGSRDKDQTTSHHQPLLSSLVVRPSTSDGGGDGAGRGSDYELGEVRREPPQYTRSDRYNDDPDAFIGLVDGYHEDAKMVSEEMNKLGVGCIFFLITANAVQGYGYRMRAGSASPVHRRDADHRYSSEYDHSGGPLRGREFGSARDSGRYRDNSPHYARGRGAGRPFSRGLDGPGPGPGPFRGEGTRNNPNVRQRLGDWICPDPLFSSLQLVSAMTASICGNLNFARREYCNNCNKFRYGPGGSPRRGYPGPPPPSGPPRRFPGPPVDPPLGRSLNGGYRSPPRGWARDGPRDFGAGMPPPRHEGRFPDHQMRRDRLDYSDNHRGRAKFDRPMPMDWGNRDRGRDSFFNERKAFERRLPSPPSPPPPPAHRGRWAHDVRERSRSPLRGGPPPKDYNRPMYMDRGRDDRRGMGRGRIGDAY